MVVPGQLLAVGPHAVPVRYGGQRRIVPSRVGRILRVNGKPVGIDLTGLEPDAAREALRGVPGASVVVWRDLAGVTPKVARALDGLGAPFSLWLGLALTATQALDLRPLASLCEHLRGLVLEGEVRWDGVATLRRCGSLRALRVVSSLPRGALRHVASLTSLRHLDLSGSLRAFGPGSEGLRPLRRLGRLVTLDLADNGLQDRELTPLGHLRHLHWLRLRGNPVTGRSLGRLARLPRLVWLDLDGTRLSNRGLSRLAGLRSLRYVRVADTRVSLRGLVAFRRARRKVKILGREDLAKVELGAVARARPGGTFSAGHVPVSRLSHRNALSGLGRNRTGVPACDQYLKLMQCYVGSMPSASRSAGRRAVRRVLSVWRRQLRTGGAAIRRQLAKTCQSSLVYLKRAVGRRPAARRCLRP